MAVLYDGCPSRNTLGPNLSVTPLGTRLVSIRPQVKTTVVPQLVEITSKLPYLRLPVMLWWSYHTPETAQWHGVTVYVAKIIVLTPPDHTPSETEITLLACVGICAANTDGV